MIWAKSQPIEHIWNKYTNGKYFKMLQCPSCNVPVHEKFFGTAHSGIGEDIGWAIHDHHVYPSTHVHVGDLGVSTTELSRLAETILMDQQAKSNLVRKTHDDPDAQNADDSQRMEQVIVAEEYELSRRPKKN